MRFNRGSLVFGKKMEAPSQELVRNTMGLVNASVEDAVRYGGELTRAALSVMDLRNDRADLIVDTKVHMLMPGFSPAIPGWHTDGVPRGERLSALAREAPRIFVQDEISNRHQGGLVEGGLRPTHFHMLVTGGGCRTEFLMNRDVELKVDETTKLYTDVSRQVDDRILADKTAESRFVPWEGPQPTPGVLRLGEFKKPEVFTVEAAPSCQVVEFDWWDLHRGVRATEHEWRFFIRVAETDLDRPERDLRKVIRTQQQVYAPEGFGW